MRSSAAKVREIARHLHTVCIIPARHRATECMVRIACRQKVDAATHQLCPEDMNTLPTSWIRVKGPQRMAPEDCEGDKDDQER